MFDLTSYLLLPDQTGVILLNRWLDLQSIIYPLAMLHTCAWVFLKVWIFWKCTVVVQRRRSRREASHAMSPRIAGRTLNLYQRLQRVIVVMAHKVYAGAKRTAHGKAVNGYSLFWIALTPLFQKVGDAIVGIGWQKFGWRGVYALCLGASIQTACYCLLYSIYGESRQAEADQLMLWIMLPLGLLMLLGWVFKNGRKKSA